jgi:hypothetical protein
VSKSFGEQGDGEPVLKFKVQNPLTPRFARVLFPLGRGVGACFTRMPKFLGRVEPARHEGDGAPKSADLWLRIRCRMRLAPLGAPIADVYRHRAPLFVAGRSWAISWLPGPRSGSGGSPDTAREPDRASAARRRRTSSRFMNAS